MQRHLEASSGVFSDLLYPSQEMWQVSLLWLVRPN